MKDRRYPFSFTQAEMTALRDALMRDSIQSPNQEDAGLLDSVFATLEGKLIDIDLDRRRETP